MADRNFILCGGTKSKIKCDINKNIIGKRVFQELICEYRVSFCRFLLFSASESNNPWLKHFHAHVVAKMVVLTSTACPLL